MGIDSPEEPMVTDRRGIVLISFQSIAEPSNHKPVLYIYNVYIYIYIYIYIYNIYIIYIVHTVIIEDIQELFQIEDAFWGCGQTLFK